MPFLRNRTAGLGCTELKNPLEDGGEFASFGGAQGAIWGQRRSLTFFLGTSSAGVQVE